MKAVMLTSSKCQSNFSDWSFLILFQKYHILLDSQSEHYLQPCKEVFAQSRWDQFQSIFFQKKTLFYHVWPQ